MSARLVGRDPETGQGIGITIADGRILGIEPADYSGALYLSPGLVDLQVNGYAHFDLNDGTVTAERVADLTEAQLALGTTTFLPTFITSSEQAITNGQSGLY